MTNWHVDFEGGNDSPSTTAPVDSSSNALTITANSGYSKSSAFHPSGSSYSAKFNNSGQGLTLAANSLFDRGTGDWTIEGWVNPIAFTNPWASLFANRNGSWADGVRAVMLQGSSGSWPQKIALVCNLAGSSTTIVKSTTTLAAGTGYYWSITKASGTVYLHINGVMEASASDSNNYNWSSVGSSGVAIGHNGWDGGNSWLNAYEATVRFTKAARYGSGNYTAPTGPLPVGSGSDPTYWSDTVLLAQLNDTPEGGTFATRLKTLSTGVSAARLDPGDNVRCMASKDPTLIGNATWTQYSPTITLASAVTASIFDCDSNWTVSANVTAINTTAPHKQGTQISGGRFAGAFTTGLAMYKAITTVDLSGYQQLSFWLLTTVAIPAGQYSLRLCSDAAGVTTVNTIALPAIAATGALVPVTVDLGANFGSSISSIALYCDTDPGTPDIYFDNIIACKASSSADSLTLNSLIGKASALNWAASTTYATNTIRKPTTPNRTGMSYRVSAGGGGSSGSTEPAWPDEIGKTVTDGALTWTCESWEDTWYGIQSIVGTTVTLDGGRNMLAGNSRGHSTPSETIATYKREPIILTVADLCIIRDSGTAAGGNITYSGGWNRTDMTTQTGETWLDNARTGSAGIYMAAGANQDFVTVEHFGMVRSNGGITGSASSAGGSYTVRYCHCNNNHAEGIYVANRSHVIGCSTNNNSLTGIRYQSAAGDLRNSSSCNNAIDNTISGIGWFNQFSSQCGLWNNVQVKNNDAWAINSEGVTMTYSYEIRNLVTDNNRVGAVRWPYGPLLLVNSLLGESTKVDSASISTLNDHVIRCQRYQQTANDHRDFSDGYTIQTATDQRHTASGVSWKFSLTSTTRHRLYPARLSLGRILCTANTTKTVKIWVYRDNANIQGQLRLPGGLLPGVVDDVVVACAPTINTWVQSASLTFTPTESGIVEIFFDCWDGVGTANHLWIDDVTVS